MPAEVDKFALGDGKVRAKGRGFEEGPQHTRDKGAQTDSLIARVHRNMQNQQGALT